MLSTTLKPATPVNPAERPIANAVLMSALLKLHPLENFNSIHAELSEQFPSLSEEIYEALENEQESRLADTCKVIQLQA